MCVETIPNAISTTSLSTTPSAFPYYGHIDGLVVIIGMGSIGKGTLPLIQRHFSYKELLVIEPNPQASEFLAKYYGEVRHMQVALAKDNYRQVLSDIFSGHGRGFCVNLSVDTSSLDLMLLCRAMNVLYIDTVVEPWPGYYVDESKDRTNYALRQAVRDAAVASPGGTTAVSCCGANPGMVSWFVKEALVTLARDTNAAEPKIPTRREDWALLMQSLGVKGVHISERDTQVRREPRPQGVFVNTWSVEGFISESLQPAELGWGTHETWFPDNGVKHTTGCMAGIWLQRPGAITQVRTWCPTPGPQFGYLVSHNEAISISDYYTVGENKSSPIYRPTCHYAYHPCDDAMLSLDEMFGSGRPQAKHIILDAGDVVSGKDELGVLLYGHANNALWYGSRLTNAEACELAPNQNATGLQVSSAILAGMVWALENPSSGIVEADEMDHVRCLQVQRPYLGPVETHYTDWTPLQGRWTNYFPDDLDENDPWQFRNVLVKT
jgi:homospermidine synthase